MSRYSSGVDASNKSNGNNNKDKETPKKEKKKQPEKKPSTLSKLGSAASTAANILDSIVKSKQGDYSNLNRPSNTVATTDTSGAAWSTTPEYSKDAKAIWREGDLS